MRILVVDDNPGIRNTIKHILASPGIVFTECANGAQAVDRYRAERPAWVLMDIMMPEMNGFKAAENIIAEDPGARIAIVTDYDDSEYRAAAKRIGARAYILKEELIKLRELCTGSAEKDVPVL